MAFIYHQVFADESGKFEQDPLIAFCAVTATPDHLASFDAAWRTLLRAYEIDSLHMKQASRLREDCGFRMRKEQTLDERTDALIPFADLINKHLEMGVIQAWDVRGFNHLSYKVLQTLGGSNDPYFLAFVRGLAHIADVAGEDARISIICDDDPATAWDLYVHYRSLGKADFNIQRKAISLSFANDKHFPALQAADMLAFLTKHEAAEQFNGVANIWRRLFDRVTTEPRPPYGTMRWFKMFADEDTLVEFAREAREEAERAIREREENKSRVLKVRPSDGDNPSRKSEGSERSDGSGEANKRREAER